MSLHQTVPRSIEPFYGPTGRHFNRNLERALRILGNHRFSDFSVTAEKESPKRAAISRKAEKEKGLV